MSEDASRDAIHIEASETSNRGRYVALLDGAVAEMTFSRANPHLIIIDHTEVPDALRARGVGEALVRRAVADARASNTRIVPLCPFAASVFRRNADLKDVLVDLLLHRELVSSNEVADLLLDVRTLLAQPAPSPRDDVAVPG